MTPSMRSFCIVLPCLLAVAIAQQQQQQQQQSSSNAGPVSTNLLLAQTQVAKGSERFALDIFKRVSDSLTGNFIMSPFSVWSLLLLTAEGAMGRTRQELDATLGLPVDLQYVRDIYPIIQDKLRVRTDTVELALNQVMFTDKNKPIGRIFVKHLVNDYKADHVTVDFNDLATAYYTINDYVANKTDGRIKRVVNEKDLRDPALLLVSAIYFRGQWTLPFNRSLTRTEDFHDESGNVIGQMPMMHRTAPFVFANIKAMNAHVLELAYGVEDRLKVLFMLPRKGDSIANMLRHLQNIGIQPVFDELAKIQLEFEGEDVEVLLPRFTTTTDFVLNSILDRMGLHDLFGAAADLSLIAPNTYLSRALHKAQIEVDEDGTVASASTGFSFGNKNTPPKFNANRPFAYVIVDKVTNLILFCGKVMTVPK